MAKENRAFRVSRMQLCVFERVGASGLCGGHKSCPLAQELSSRAAALASSCTAGISELAHLEIDDKGCSDEADRDRPGHQLQCWAICSLR